MTAHVMTDLLAYNCNLNAADLIAHLNNPPPFALVRHSFMHDLAREGDVLSAEVVFDAGAPVDQPNDEGRRPLHEAAAGGHLEMAGFLLHAGAELDAPVHPLGHTALYLAVQRGHHAVAQYLIGKGARLDAADALFGTGLLHAAAERDDMRMAGLLISSGIDVFREDKRGMTARDIAARRGHRDLARALLKVMEHQAQYAG